MSCVCSLFSEFEEEIWGGVAAGEPMVGGKVAALRGRWGMDLSPAMTPGLCS